MNINEILQSLAELQNSLSEIDSAKQQVFKIIDSSTEFSNAAASCKVAFDGLSSGVAQMIERINELNLNMISDLTSQTESLRDELSKLNEFNQKLTSISQSIEKLQANAKKRDSEITVRFESLDAKLEQITQQMGEVHSRITDPSLFEHIKKWLPKRK
jgi:uncharacterized phage infection (PIP) family protein YhgE